MDRCLKMFACSVCETWGVGCQMLHSDSRANNILSVYVVADVYTICVYSNGTCTNIVCITTLVVVYFY